MNAARSPQTTPTPLPPTPLKDADGIVHGVNWTHPSWVRLHTLPPCRFIAPLTSPPSPQLQSPWWTNAVSCHRPPVKLNAPIVCVAETADDAPERPRPFRLLGDGEDLDLFEPCCPRSDNATKLNLYTTRRSCPGPVCFTHDLAAAKNWTTCLHAQVSAKISELEGKGGRELEGFQPRMMEGECQYVNWDLVNLGLLDRDNLPPGLSDATRKGSGIRAVMIWGLLLTGFMNI